MGLEVKVKATEFPRTLVVTQAPFNLQAGNGIALTNYFHDWPADRVAQIFVSDFGVKKDTSVCREFYQISGNEIRYFPVVDWYFRALRWKNRAPKRAVDSSSSGSGQHTTMENPEAPVPSSKIQPVRQIKKVFENALMEYGFYEGVDYNSTPEIRQFIRDFNPDVIFSTLGDLLVTRMTQRISEEFDLPLVLHVGDDWMATYGRRNLCAKLLGSVCQKEVSHTLKMAVHRYSACNAMNSAFEKRYGLGFEPMTPPVDVASWQGLNEPRNGNREAVILYAGTIHANAQLDSLVDVSHAVQRLSEQNYPCKLLISLPQTDCERYAEYFNNTNTVFVPHDSRESLASLISGADALLLPVIFDQNAGAIVKYSMPGKATLYMATGKPTLVYGPSWSPVVQEALEKQTSLVLNERNEGLLVEALKRIFDDQQLRATLSLRAREVAIREYDISIIAARFRDDLARASKKAERLA